MKKAILLIIVALFWLPIFVGAETIYTWKDKDGVLRFSNEPPPEHIEEYQITESAGTGSQSNEQSNQRRSSYDTMVRRATIDADASREKREKEAAAKAAEKKRIAEEKEQARIAAERKRLEEQINAIKNRAVSPTYPYGMKQAQIEALKKEIEKLNKGAGKK
jgi:hypothetical protein